LNTENVYVHTEQQTNLITISWKIQARWKNQIKFMVVPLLRQ